MKKLEYPVFDKVVFIAPEKRGGKGGISSVIESYSECFVPFHYLGTNSRYGKAVGWLRAIATFFRLPVNRLKGQKIAHFHYASGKSWIRKRILMDWARTLGFKVVAHCHSCEWKDYTRRVGYNKIKKVLDKASANIVLSKEWEDFFVNTLKVSNVHIINNIVFPPRLASIKSDKSKPISFLFMGLIGDRKGIFEILMALHNLKEKGFDFRLTVGGNGEISRFQSTVKSLGLEENIDFKGWMRGETKDQCLAECDVLLLPSHAEGLPIAILEAMSYGKAVLSSTVGGIPTVIENGKNGFLVTPGAIDEIENYLRSYIEDRDLAYRQGQMSLQKITPFYPETVGKQLSEIYNGLL